MSTRTNEESATPAEPAKHPGLKQLERLVGTWKMEGATQGQLTYEWPGGGYSFKLTRVKP